MGPLSSDEGTEHLPRFARALEAEGYRGEIASDRAPRVVYATDNSVYEVPPLAVLFPREPDDLNRILRAARKTGMPLAARGGGTGTNGQSLSDGIVVDCSRYLTHIEHIDPQLRLAVVQPGVILDELNRAAAAHNLFFAPSVSTASRATLGGMAATDASGKGSRVFGRTSDHIHAMEVALADGSDWRAEPLDAEALDTACQRQDLAGGVHRVLRDILAAHAEEIERVYPVMNRGLTGYNLKELRDAEGPFRLSKLLAGSEGTLALTKRLTLRLLPKKRLRALMVVAYDDTLAALRDAARLVEADPTAVEFIDDKIMALAQDDPVWTDIAGVLGQEGPRRVRGLNLVEAQADDEDELARALARFDALQAGAPPAVVSQRVVREPGVIAQIWALRAKCVGLLGRMDPSRQGTPFVEDAAVPPSRLADFVAGFRDILDAQGLSYGMFGHADVGCVHVRPALDMRRADDAAKIRVVSDAVARLAREHGGLIWGEHGKGFRGEYGPQIFGPRLYAALCQIKAAFDPQNLLNPGKIASPDPGTPLTAIDAVPFRGSRDAQITPKHLEGFEAAVKCNGNGQCFNRDFDDAMCPSYKATGDRLQSPKGRAALLREWARLRSDAESAERRAVTARAALPGLEERLHRSLSTCLGCKACASQCPVKVDIPAMRSLFFEQHYARKRRPLRHHLLAALERVAPAMRIAPRLTNAGLRLAAPILRWVGLVDLPPVQAPSRPPESIAVVDLPPQSKVALVEDSFLGVFDGRVIDAAHRLLEGLGYEVMRIPLVSNGKAAHVLGLRRAFERAAKAGLARLHDLARGHTLVGIEPAVLAMQAAEHRDLGSPPILSIDRFLEAELSAGRLPVLQVEADLQAFHLFPHCIETSGDPRASQRWTRIFQHFGRVLRTETTGCCGMAGIFGHERENLDLSRRLFDLSWRDRLASAGPRALATGFSCRCQAKRFAGARPPHPVEILSRLVPSGAAGGNGKPRS